MFDKLESVENRFLELESRLSEGDLSGAEYAKITKERGQLEELVYCYREYKVAKEDLATAEELIRDPDPDMRSMGKEESARYSTLIEELENRLRLLTLPRDPNDDKNVILEVRAGTGGDEAGIFAGDLLRMYQRFADKKGWRTELLSSTESSSGGFKEVVLLVSGDNVFSQMKFEMGVHRVQRIPQTETQGRIHTSACTVAILPEAEEVEVDINPKDLEISTTRSSGAGGQHVNTTDSAIRIVHIPSGIAVECQAERSQHKNKDRAMKVLKARLLEKAQMEQSEAISADRKGQVGSGDRSERIRTYNFPQGRMTDHRINLTLYKLDAIMEGAIEEVLEALAADHQTRLMKEQLEGQPSS